MVVEGKKVKNLLYATDDSGELIWVAGNFLRQMCYEEAPFLPTPDECENICRHSCAWHAPQLRKDVMYLGGYRERESLLPGLSESEKKSLCLLPSDVDGNTHQIAFQLCGPELISQGTYTLATRAPQRSYGNRKHLDPADERSLWIHELDKATHEVPQVFPPSLWLHPDRRIRDSVGEPYKWPRVNKTPGKNSHIGTDAVLGSPCCDVWNHHMRRDARDGCTAIPRTDSEWPVLSDEQLEIEGQMRPLDKAPDIKQATRLWNAHRYAPQRQGPSRWQAGQSTSSGSQQERALAPRGQRDWIRQTNTNAAWGGASSGSQQTRNTTNAKNTGSKRWWPDI